MNTVTINLEEYLELRKLRDQVYQKTYYIRYVGIQGSIVCYEFYTNDEALNNIINANKGLVEKINNLVIKIEESKIKKKWWKS